jgi:hypothetical protein
MLKSIQVHEPPNVILFPKENKVVTLAKKFARGTFKPKRKPVFIEKRVLPVLK